MPTVVHLRLFVLAVLLATPARAAETPTLRQIMSDPEWIARSPERPCWTWDGSAVVYERKREGSRLRSRWIVSVGAEGAVEGQPVNGRVIADGDLPYAAAVGGAFNADRTRKVFERSGDVFVRDMETGELGQLTRTTVRESSPMFMLDGSVAFRRGGVWVIRRGNGLERQAADIRLEDDPEETAEAEKEGRSSMEERQHELFAIVRDREAREDEREDQEAARREADATRVPGPFYLGEGPGDGWEIHRRDLSPGGRWLLLTVATDTGEGERDVMPAYVNEDGLVSTRKVRPKVGEAQRRDDRLVLLDLESGSAHWLSADGLPMIEDDPLAWLKEMTAEDPGAAGDTGDAEGDREQDPEADGADGADGAGGAGGADDESPEPRAVTVERVEWSADGERVAVQMHSNDNKDRWIAAVDFKGGEEGEPVMASVHHLRDEAWINWRYNEMGWRRDGAGLWFLSEESGYSHLYHWSAITGELDQITEGEFTIQGVVERPRGGVVYFRMNRDDPRVYEIGRLRLPHNDGSGDGDDGGGGDRVVSVYESPPGAVTSMGGTVESFEIAPRGDRIVFRWSTAMDPPELYTLALPGPEEDARDEVDLDLDPVRLTRTDTELYRSFDWVEPEFVEVPSSHVDEPVHCRVYDDPGVAAPSGRGKPVVLFSHGSGYTQHVYNGWSYYFREHLFHTLLCRMGYVVIAPDFRASAGYGRDWRTAIYRVMGYPELEDFDDSLAWLGANHDVDLDNVGIYGGSYGGFMTLMAMFLRPDVYGCGAALRSVTDWMHYNDGYTSNILDRPGLDMQPFIDSSPISHAEGLEGALLMCHGMLDDNVVAQDTIRLAQRLIELEKEDWEMALYPVEPHGFREPTGWLDEYRRILKLFEEHLKD